MDAIVIGQTIREIREEQGYTQATLGKAIKTSEQYVSALERGVRKPGPKLIKKLCAALGTTEEQILYAQQSDAHRLLYNLAGKLSDMQATQLSLIAQKLLAGKDID